MIIETFEQYSPEYWDVKIGTPSSSHFSEIVTSTGKKSKSWEGYACRLAAEIEMGRPVNTYMSADMARGTALEPKARKAYEFIKDVRVKEVGVIYSDERKLWLCSPDGITTGGLEIKNRIAKVHKQHKYKGVIPATNKPQVFGSLWMCDELDFWDYFSWHPEMAPLIVRVTRDDPEYKVYAEALEKYLPEFCKLVKEISNG